MITHQNYYFNMLFVRPSVHLVIKKLRGGGIKTQSINDQMDRKMDKRQVEIAI